MHRDPKDLDKDEAPLLMPDEESKASQEDEKFEGVKAPLKVRPLASRKLPVSE